MSSRRRVSLSYELDELSTSLEAARLLAVELGTDQFATQHDALQAPRMIATIARLAIARIRLVNRALRGTLDPRVVHEEFNDAPSDMHDEADVFLTEWNPTKMAASARAELARAERQLSQENRDTRRRKSRSRPKGGAS